MSDRLYSDPKFYVRVQKSKIVLIVALAVIALLSGGFDKYFG